MKTLFTRLVAVALGFTALASNAVPIDLSSFSVIQFPGSQPENANWVLGAGNTSITQTNNNNLSFYLSDFDVSNSQIQWNGRAINGDDDVIGFVWGFQDTANFYQLFWWGQSSSAALYKVENGIWENIGFDPVQWQLNVNCQFLFDFLPGNGNLEITAAGSPVVQIQTSDSTWSTGKFGFLTESQAGSFNTLEIEPLSPPGIPVPGSLELTLLGIVALAFRKQRRT